MRLCGGESDVDESLGLATALAVVLEDIVTVGSEVVRKQYLSGMFLAAPNSHA